MTKTITVEFTDAEIASLKTAYSAEDADATVAQIKAAFISLVKSDMRSYDKRQARNNISYTPLDPK
jgi:predicted glycosyl hydrolase (DUF1957 family)